MTLFAICYTTVGIISGVDCYYSITQKDTAELRTAFTHKLKVAQDNGLIDIPEEKAQRIADVLETTVKVVTSIVIGVAWPVFTISNMVREAKETLV